MYVLCYLYLYTYNIYYLSNNVWHLKSFPASTDIKYLKTLPEAQRTQDIESKNWIISKKKNSPSCVASARRSSGRSSGRRCWSRTGWSTPTPTLIPTCINRFHKSTQSRFSPWKKDNLVHTLYDLSISKRPFFCLVTLQLNLIKC